MVGASCALLLGGGLAVGRLPDSWRPAEEPELASVAAALEANRAPALVPAPAPATAVPEPAPAAPAAAAPVQTAPPPPTTTAATEAPKRRRGGTPARRVLPAGGTGTWAVVLGVDDYGGSGNLQSGVADADEIVATLIDSGVPGDQILLLRNWQVTAQTIVQAADWLVDHAGPDSLAVFAWAGHVRALDSKTEALATGNGGLVTDATLASHLVDLRARNSWFLIAGCYGGGFTELLGPGRLLTAASTAETEAYESTAFGHSYLVEYVVRRGIHRRESSRVVASAVAWAQGRLRSEHPGREPYNYTTGPVDPFVLGPNPIPSAAELAAA